MNSETQEKSQLLSTTACTERWNLPYEAVVVLKELPDPAQDNKDSTASVKDQDMKRVDLALRSLQDSCLLMVGSTIAFNSDFALLSEFNTSQLLTCVL
uniref:Uncharacterized protein n=1 Tax=Panthera leo TaxID=9689 RepID=A0A8C8XI30_PANLE